MAIDYALNFNCDAKSNIPEEKFLLLVRGMALAEHSAQVMRQQHPEWSIQKILNDVTVNFTQTRPDGKIEEAPVTIGELVARAEPLRKFKDQCANCRANVADRSFGCVAKINYPIKKESEEWLVSRLPDDEKDPALQILFKYITDLELDGSTVDKARERAKIFDMKHGAVRKWGGMFSKRKITSSQILEFMLFAGDIIPDQARLYTKILRLDSVLSDPHPKSSNIEQFKTFMCAVVMAGRLNANIKIDR